MFSRTLLLQATYLLFAIAGAVFPTLANIDFMMQYGASFDLVKFIELANINPAAVSLSRDLLISSSCLIVWIFVESKRLKIKNTWIVFLGTFTISFAFSAPLFLFLRERRLLEIDKSD